MGTWGTGIYSNDVAEDVRELCKEVYPFVTVDVGNDIIFEAFKDIIASDCVDDEQASFWFALSDWQWKHGILLEKIRSKAINLLNENAGLEYWLEVGNAAEIKKRQKVLEQLRIQLASPMPKRKIPEARLAKPKHKAGDVVIFRTCSHESDQDGFLWEIKSVGNQYLFQDPAIALAEEPVVLHFSAHQKYMAVLCVGTRQVQHSQYLPNLYDEHSIYAFYDFLAEQKPSLQELQTCGFLPSLNWNWKDFNQRIHGNIGWSYMFSMEKSLIQDAAIVIDCEKLYAIEESERFHGLMERKKYLMDVDSDFYDLSGAFKSFWANKIRMERLGKTIDNLLDINITNPGLLAPHEADLAYRGQSN